MRVPFLYFAYGPQITKSAPGQDVYVSGTFPNTVIAIGRPGLNCKVQYTLPLERRLHDVLQLYIIKPSSAVFILSIEGGTCHLFLGVPYKYFGSINYCKAVKEIIKSQSKYKDVNRLQIYQNSIQ